MDAPAAEPAVDPVLPALLAKASAVVALPMVTVNRKAELKNCVLDSNVVIPEGLVVGQDPVEDAKWFRVSEGGVVLITQDMLDARAAKLS